MITIDLFYNTYFILYFIILFITFIIYKMRRIHRFSFWFIGIFEAYILFIIKVGILPIRFIANNELRELIQVTQFEKYFQLIPFNTIIKIYENGININMQLVGNVLLFFPMPIFIAFFMKNIKYYKILLISFCTTICLETIQLIINIIIRYPARIFDIDDVILNVFGIILGIIVFIVIKKIKHLYKFLCENVVYT